MNWVFQSSLDPGPQKLLVHYRVPNGSTSHRWFINGALMGSHAFPKAGGSWQEAAFEVHLEKGRNSFVIVREGEAIDLDWLSVGVK